MIHVDESFAGREVKLAVGESLEIRLPENRTAGYRCRLIGDMPAYLTVHADSSVAPTSSSGTAGTHVWKLEGKSEGSAKINFEYARSWEDSAKPARKFAVTIRVAG